MGMMMFLKMFGLVSFVFTVLLLAVSFFVIYFARKVEMQALKVFGYVIAILLWICAAIIFSSVISLNLAGRSLRMPMMRARPPMMQPEMPGTMQGEEMMQQKMGGSTKSR